MRSIAVTARWDEESRSWWTDGEDVPGLCCQGHSFEELCYRLGVGKSFERVGSDW